MVVFKGVSGPGCIREDHGLLSPRRAPGAEDGRDLGHEIEPAGEVGRLTVATAERAAGMLLGVEGQADHDRDLLTGQRRGGLAVARPGGLHALGSRCRAHW